MRRSHNAFRPSCESMETRRLLSAASETVVTGLFRQVLLRDPGPQELARFSRSVDAGVSEARVAARLYDSNEFRRDVLTSYYEEILERQPTEAELGRWSRALAAGGSEARVAAAIAGSPESVERFDGDRAAYVRSISVGLLGRQADEAELATYVSQLQKGAAPTIVAAAITRTASYRVGKIQEAYQAVLGRLPSASEAADWASRWSANRGLRGVSLRILDGRENAARLRGGAVSAPDLAAVNELKQILLAPYTEANDGFVNTFNRLLGTRPAEDAEGDPVASPPTNTALWGLTKAGGRDGRPLDEVRTVATMTVPVAALTPLQSEVDIDKSLGFALGAAPAQSDLEEYLAGGAIKPFGGPILTGGGGRYIVDGHHRWSSLFVINPDAQISALDIGYAARPQDYLKVAQLAVGAAMGYLQVQSVEGQNLFTIGRADFDAWVARTIADGDDPQGVLAVFKQARGLDGIPAIAAFLWGNVERMRLGNQPFPGVTSRDYMPQPPSGGVDEMVAWFESGALNSRFPMVPRLG